MVSRKNALRGALLVVFLQVVGALMTAVYLPTLKLDFFDGSYSKASLVSGIFDGLTAVLAVYFLPTFGHLSDKLGRKPFILLTAVLSAVPNIVLALRLNLWVYFLTGLFTWQSFTLAYAYISDITRHNNEEKTLYFGYTMASVFASFIAGPLLAAPLNEVWTLRGAAFMSILNVVFVVFCLPESLPDPEPFLWFNKSPGGAFVRMDSTDEENTQLYQPVAAKTQDSEAAMPKTDSVAADGSSPVKAAKVVAVVCADAPPAEMSIAKEVSLSDSLAFIKQSPLLLGLVPVVFLSSLAEEGILDTTLLVLKDALHFTPADNVRLLIVVGLSTTISMLCVFPPLVAKWGEFSVIAIGVTVNMLRFIFYNFAQQKWQALTLEVFGGLAFMSFPAVGMLVSRYMDLHEQGLALGAMGGIRAFTSGIGPLLFAGCMSYFTSSHAPFQYARAPFFLAAVFLIGAVSCLYRVPAVYRGVPPRFNPPNVQSDSKAVDAERDEEAAEVADA